jgi:hypothetical protein
MRRLEVIGTGQEEWRRLCGTGRLYAVVDSCDEPAVPKKVNELEPGRAVSLYLGGSEEQYSQIAPYLICVDAPCFDWITGSLWGSPWGIFAYAGAPMEALRKHFRRFLSVKSTDNKEYLLRFYDPRILPAFLGSCNEAELAGFFGPVEAYGATKGAGVSLLRLRATET